MIWIALMAGLAAGGGLGAALGFLMCDRRSRGRLAALETGRAVDTQRCEELTRQLDAERTQCETLRQRVESAEKQCAATAAQLDASRQNLLEQRKLLDEANAQLKQAFATVSAEALARNSETFLHLAQQRFNTLSTQASGSLEEKKAQIEGLLKPIRELLGQYQSRLGEIEKSRVEAYSSLREQLGSLAETQRVLKTQTNQLVNALSRPQTRGQWGEISLRRLVELAGMTSRCDFLEQATVDGDDGRLRPDMIVNLPGERQVVIDCKTVLDAYLDAMACTDEQSRKACLARHSQQVRSRARDLGAKSYWSQFGRSPEFVVMFLPGEAFLYAAVEHDPLLLEDALSRRVIVATPTTLIALLKAIEYGWRQEAISENAEAIRELGRELFERIATMSEHFERLGSSLDAVVKNYNRAIGSLESRVVVTARKMGELGAAAGKPPKDLSPVETQPRELSAALRALPEGDTSGVSAGATAAPAG